MKKRARFKDFESEEKWLNQLGDEGYVLIKRDFLGSYVFEKASLYNQGGNVNGGNYKVDFRMFKKKSEFSEYVQFFNDCGWIHVCGTHSSGNQYFINKDGDVSSEIFSDADSKASRYLRLRDNWITLLCMYSAVFIVLVLNNAIDVSSFFNPKLLYYTPGLWEMQGGLFWRAFLFETPFALARGFSWTFFVVLIIISLYYTIRLSLQYKKKD